jgi:prepilin-type N-terminal cleavage/methylation domain-containing protein
MKKRSMQGKRGFSLLEMTIAMALGALVLGAAVHLYSQGVNATWVVSQRAEMQQDFRAASNMLTKDLSLAGAGLGNNVQIALVTAAKTPVYGCDQTKCYINGAPQPFPKQGSTPYMYGLVPGYQIGPLMNGTATDATTVVYTDNNFYLSCFNAKVTSATTVKFQINTGSVPPGCLPTGATLTMLDDAVFGITAGDVILLTVASGSGSGATISQIVAEATAVPAVASPDAGYTNAYTATFAYNDALLMNQSGSSAGGLGNVNNWIGTGTRLQVISYYIDTSVSPARLMRQVSGHTPMPVAENIAFLQFSYDSYANGVVTQASRNAGATLTPALTPNQVTKINIDHMAMDSTLNSGLYGNSKGFQGMDLQTSVSARDLTYQNGYPIGN